jgi:hypothetical protein
MLYAVWGQGPGSGSVCGRRIVHTTYCRTERKGQSVLWLSVSVSVAVAVSFSACFVGVWVWRIWRPPALPLPPLPSLPSLPSLSYALTKEIQK